MAHSLLLMFLNFFCFFKLSDVEKVVYFFSNYTSAMIIIFSAEPAQSFFIKRSKLFIYIYIFIYIFFLSHLQAMEQ